MISKVFVVFALLSVGYGYELRQCKKGPLPTKVVIDNCKESDEKCPLYRGESGKAEITFKVPSDQEMMFVKVVAHVAGLPVTFPMPDPNVCNSLLQGMCPVDEGEQITYQFNVPVKKLYPKISMDLEVSMLDENKEETLTCFILPARVVDRNLLIYNKRF